MPVFEKRRFQRGAVAQSGFDSLFPANELPYRQAFAELYSARSEMSPASGGA